MPKPPEGVPAAFSERRFKYLKLIMPITGGWDHGTWSWEPSDDLYISNIQIGHFPIGVHQSAETGTQIGRIAGAIDPAVGGEETHGVYMTNWKWFKIEAASAEGTEEFMTRDRKFTPPLFIAQLRPLYVSTYRDGPKTTMDVHVNIIFEYWTKP